jgi:hypothetical protein
MVFVKDSLPVAQQKQADFWELFQRGSGEQDKLAMFVLKELLYMDAGFYLFCIFGGK